MSRSGTPIHQRRSVGEGDDGRSTAEKEAAMSLDVFASLASSMRSSASQPSIHRGSTVSEDTSVSNNHHHNTLDEEDEEDDDLAVDDSKRLEHNFCERRRRENIKAGFQGLQAAMTSSAVKLSKMEILRSGIMTIKKLTTEIELLEAELKRLRSMKEARASGGQTAAPGPPT